MKKVYSIIILMCSFCMAGFATEAKLMASELPAGGSPEALGAQGVVIGPTNMPSGVRNGNAGTTYVFGAGVYTANPSTCSIGWIYSNNLKAYSENNLGCSPGAGFAIHTNYDEHGNYTTANIVLTGSSSYRVFAFIRVSGIRASFNHLSSPISSPSKLKNYG
jgi:hypothetical protein